MEGSLLDPRWNRKHGNTTENEDNNQTKPEKPRQLGKGDSSAIKGEISIARGPTDGS